MRCWDEQVSGEDSWVWEQPALEGHKTWKLKDSLGKMPGFRG